MFWLLLLALLSIVVSGAVSKIEVISSKIGSTTINITKETFPIPANCMSCTLNLGFLNLHENENTSVVAARSFLYLNGGTLVKFDKGHTRLVSFTLGSTKYNVDPNRIYTPEGINATLKDNNSGVKITSELITEVQKLATAVLNIYNYESQSTILALHNNAGSYGAMSYLPGGAYAKDASDVYINPDSSSNPSDFFYVVNPDYFTYLSQHGYNIVLQNNATVTNDGSLSYYAGITGKQYINFESIAEYSAYGKQTIIQLDMIEAVKTMLLN